MVKKEKTYYLTNIILTIISIVVIIWLRTDGELAERFARIQIGDLLCSTSDFFLIVATALCGYRYGTVILHWSMRQEMEIQG
ncbi:MAG: hypothetical protein IJ733_20390 [Lachnospiraceae bacterium]|nr:hypothetical protein [Lachnospiraceae bacterium]